MIGPKLIKVGEWYGLDKHDLWLCRSTLESHVDIPDDATHIWVEICKRQWKDKSGIEVVLTISEETNFQNNCSIGNHTEFLVSSARKYLLKKFLKLDIRTVAYFRVWYV